jgi:hypothetical protein
MQIVTGNGDELTEGWTDADWAEFDAGSSPSLEMPSSEKPTIPDVDFGDDDLSWDDLMAGQDDDGPFSKIAIAQQVVEGVAKTKSWDDAQWAKFRKALSDGLTEGGDNLKLITLGRYEKSVEGIEPLQKSIEEWRASGASSVAVGLIKNKFYAKPYRGK